MLCDDLEGWDGGGGRETQEGGDIYIYIYTHTHTYTFMIGQQKLTQHCKEITFQLKK